MIRLFSPLRCYSSYSFQSAFCAPLSFNGDECYAYSYRWDTILNIRFGQHFVRHYRHTEMNETLILTAEMPSSAAIPHRLCVRYDHRHTNHHTLVLTVEMLSWLFVSVSIFVRHYRYPKLKWNAHACRWDATVVLDCETPPLNLGEDPQIRRNSEWKKANKQIDA